MPEDLLLIYCKRICAILRKKINGEIYVNANGNSIVTDISWGEFQYQCITDYIHRLVYRGVSSETIADYIYRSYRRSLLKEAFI
jgi:hypothetical protein